MKIYVCSDWHLGYEHTNYPKIKEILELVQTDADQLILCGDIYDLWRCEINEITTQEPMKSCHETLVETTQKVPTTIVWGNHDYDLWKKTKLFNVRDDFVQDGIYFAHGWRWDAEQRFGYPLYGWLVELFPYIYQRFFKTPFEIIDNKDQYTKQIDLICKSARRFIEKKGYKYLVFGHTHFPMLEGKLVNCGDFINDASYVIIVDGTPYLIKI